MLKNAVASGLRWRGFGRIFHQIVSITIGIFLARLLSPEAFGLVGMATVFMGFGSALANFGLANALIQRPRLSDQHLQVAFWLSTVLGILLTAIFFFAAPWIEGFYGIDLVTEITRALSVLFLLRALPVVPRALLMRKMDFRTLTVIEIISSLLPGIGALVAAAAGWGIWSLVVLPIGEVVLSVGLLFALTRWTPRVLVTRQAFTDIFGFSTNLTGFNLINYWARHLDNLLIGKFFGAASLGVYSKSYSFMMLPISHINAMTASVMIPALSRVQDDPKRHRRIYLRANIALTLLTFPMLMGLLATAESFVLGLLGEQWRAMIPLVRILSLSGLIQVLMNPTGWIYVSKGRTDWMLRWALFGATILIVSIIIGVALGSVTTVAWSYLVANSLLLYPGLMVAGRLTGLTASRLLRSVAPNFACATMMAMVVHLFGMQIQKTFQPIMTFIFQVAIGISVYAVLVLLLRWSVLMDIRDLFLGSTSDSSKVP